MHLPLWTRRLAAVLAAVLLTLGSAAMLIADLVLHDPDGYRGAAVFVVLGFGLLLWVHNVPTGRLIERARQDGYTSGYRAGRRVARPAIVPRSLPRLPVEALPRKHFLE